jgi:hypothetical protein
LALQVPEPPRPIHSILPDLSSLNCLQAVVRPRQPAATSSAAPDVDSCHPLPQWALEHSIFAPRPAENDSRGWLDAPDMDRRVLDCDWAVCADKARFRALVDKWAPAAGERVYMPRGASLRHLSGLSRQRGAKARLLDAQQGG